MGVTTCWDSCIDQQGPSLKTPNFLNIQLGVVGLSSPKIMGFNSTDSVVGNDYIFGPLKLRSFNWCALKKRLILFLELFKRSRPPKGLRFWKRRAAARTATASQRKKAKNGGQIHEDIRRFSMISTKLQIAKILVMWTFNSYIQVETPPSHLWSGGSGTPGLVSG